MKKLALLALLFASPAYAWDTITLTTASFDTVCGAKVDSGSGASYACTGKTDNDRDGYDNTQDPDDSDRDIVPGVYRTCGTDGYQLAQSDATWDTCTENATTPLCEATGSGTCYYVDPDSGSDTTGDGSFATPWQTLDKLKYYATSGDKPAGWIAPAAGDRIYLFEDSDQSTYGSYYDNSSFGYNVLMFRGYDGTAANRIVIKPYPGQSVKFQPTYGGADERNIFYLLQSDYFDIEGIEISGASGHRGNGVAVVESIGNQILGNNIHSGKVNTSNGSAGAVKFLDCESCLNQNNIYYNWYDDDWNLPSSGSVENSVLVRIFRGSTTHKYNVIGNDTLRTASQGGACLQQKHGDNADSITVEGNIIFGCAYYYGIGISGANATVTKNIIREADAGVSFENVGGTTANQNLSATYNSVAQADTCLQFLPEDAYYPVGNLDFKYNVCESDSSTSMILLSGDPLGSGIFDSDENCFYTTATMEFNAYSTSYTFATWKSGYSQDANSVVIDPALDSNNEAQGTGCTSWGWRLTSITGTPTPTPTPTATPTNTPTPVATATPAPMVTTGRQVVSGNPGPGFLR